MKSIKSCVVVLLMMRLMRSRRGNGKILKIDNKRLIDVIFRVLVMRFLIVLLVEYFSVSFGCELGYCRYTVSYHDSTVQ